MTDIEKIQKRLEALRFVATHYGWQEIQHDDYQQLVCFKHPDRPECGRINVWYKRMTVGTALAHPYRGKTQLFRRFVKPKEMQKIFINPRTHTGRGYYTRKEHENREMKRILGKKPKPLTYRRGVVNYKQG